MPTLADCHLPLTVPYQPMRMTVEQYHNLIDAGTFAENERFELLEGVIVEKMTKKPAHVLACGRCEALIARWLPSGWHIRSQDPITLAGSEPEPDVAVVRGKLDDYGARHPNGDEVALIVEVAETSLVTDRYKAQIYAAAGIPCYWIVNLPERVVEVYAMPNRRGKRLVYSEPKRCQAEDEIPVIIEGNEVGRIRAGDLLP